jgi:PPM family protein phosphatase
MTLPLPYPTFAPGLDVAARSATGVPGAMRDENQDNYLLIDESGLATYLSSQEVRHQRLPAWPAGHARVAVLDGMGGHGHGREAAEAVVEGLLKMPACASLAELGDHLDSLHSALQQRFGRSIPKDKRPGTTLTLLEFPPHQAALLYHVGDSRLYEVAQGRVMPLTIDHVPATGYAMGGVLGEDEWWRQVHGEHRSQISQAFILGSAFSNTGALSDPLFSLSPELLPPWLAHMPDRRAMVLEPGAVYVLATDGFWSCQDPVDVICHWPRLLDGKADARSLCDALFEDMLARPPESLFPDNLTAIVLRCTAGGETALPVSGAA